MTRITLREKIIQVVIEDNNIRIEKCEEYDNFDDHGADWELPLDDLDEVYRLVTLLSRAINIIESGKNND